MSYRVFVSKDRLKLIRQWDDGKLELCTRDAESHSWGAPVSLSEDRS